MAEEPQTPPSGESKDGKDRHEELSKPPKDKREITIGPTNGAGPDITLG